MRSIRGVSVLLALAGCLSFVACAAPAKPGAADLAVVQFHQRLNASDFHGIYSTAADGFRNSVSEKEFTEFGSAVVRKLGPFQSAKRTGWNSSVTTGGSFITMSYDSQFAEGGATEQFVLQSGRDGLRVLRYDINSRALIVR